VLEAARQKIGIKQVDLTVKPNVLMKPIDQVEIKAPSLQEMQ